MVSWFISWLNSTKVGIKVGLNSKTSIKTQPWNVKPYYNVFYVSWNKKNLNKNVYDKLHPSGFAPACINGTPKMHKFSSSVSFPKLCPVVSSINTFNYNIARFVYDLLSSLVPNDYSCKDTFSFASQFKNANLSDQFFVSYDIVYLYIYFQRYLSSCFRQGTRFIKFFKLFK